MLHIQAVKVFCALLHFQAVQDVPVQQVPVHVTGGVPWWGAMDHSERQVCCYMRAYIILVEWCEYFMCATEWMFSISVSARVVGSNF